MARYSISNRTTNGTIANPCLEIRAGTTSGRGVLVKRMSIYMAAATASTFGLGRPQAIGITPTTPVTLTPNEPNSPATTVQTALAWATPPTVPLLYFRRIALPATISANVVWEDLNIYIPSGGSLVLWNITATGVIDVNVEVEA